MPALRSNADLDFSLVAALTFRAKNKRVKCTVRANNRRISFHFLSSGNGERA
jgi:hypothetical protein